MLNKIELTAFTRREVLVEQVAKLSGLPNESVESYTIGGRSVALQRLAKIAPEAYQKDRNFLDGHVSQLSPYIRHGLISPVELQAMLLSEFGADVSARLVQQLSWREYFHLYLSHHPHSVWQDIEPYKTGFTANEYEQALPHDIARGETGVRVIDQMIAQLRQQGWLHNHARLYLAAYVVHWRKVAWQAGAKWFLTHLLDGDIASNNLSWQWVASTFSRKPYYFNLENLEKFSRGTLDCTHPSNQILAGSYEQLREQLFPYSASEVWA